VDAVTSDVQDICKFRRSFLLQNYFGNMVPVLLHLFFPSSYYSSFSFGVSVILMVEQKLHCIKTGIWVSVVEYGIVGVFFLI